MNLRAIPGWEAESPNAVQSPNDARAVHPFRSPVSRRGFVRTIAGTAAIGTTLGSGIQTPETARSRWSFAPVPIPGGTPALGGYYHLFGPSPVPGGDPIDAEPVTITNLDGFVGLAYISGNVTRTNINTGERVLLPFVDADMRFMQGKFRGTDALIHEAAFAFVWVDVYLPGPGKQIHDLNPTGFPPVGLFWTIEIPIGGIDVRVEQGSASMRAFNVPILDYGDIPNALFGGGSAPVPGSVSFKVVWSGVEEKIHIRNTDPVYGGFEGEFVHNSAQMEWRATVGNFTFESAPLATSSSSFAEIGREQNGSFFL
jgi:hypothetical protein